MQQRTTTAIFLAVSLVAVTATGLAPSASAEHDPATDCLNIRDEAEDEPFPPLSPVLENLDQVGDMCGEAVEHTGDAVNDLWPSSDPVPEPCEDPNIPCEVLNVSVNVTCVQDCDPVSETVNLVEVNMTGIKTPVVTWQRCEVSGNPLYFVPNVEGQEEVGFCPVGSEISGSPSFVPVQEVPSFTAPGAEIPGEQTVSVDIAQCAVSVTLMIGNQGLQEETGPLSEYPCATLAETG